MYLLHHDNGDLVTSRISVDVAKTSRALHVHLGENTPGSDRAYATHNTPKSGVIGEHRIGAFKVVVGLNSLKGEHEEGGDFHRCW